ncbi:MAG: CYTH domain-containing protein [Aureispira sp.]|nr:CYTH domain-containing protein [Aureispira sp.]
MSFINVEIKARCHNHSELEQILLDHQARYVGQDHQIDTYFKVPKGRMKLREGNIENSLLHYHRPNTEEAKTSTIAYYKTDPDQGLKDVLLGALEELVVVDKKRKIFFIDNVKFHLDEVKDLGTFMEIEAIDQEGTIGEAKLQEQCQYYIKLLGISSDDFIAVSYSDILLAHSKENWVKLASSNKQTDLNTALEIAANIAPSVQRELTFWLSINSNILTQKILFNLLDEEHQDIANPETTLAILNHNRDYVHLDNTDDFIAKRVILNMQKNYIPAFQQKITFINNYMDAASCSMEKAKDLYEQLTQDPNHSDEVKRWIQLASSPDETNRELALQTAGSIKEQLQAPIACWLLMQKSIVYRIELFELLDNAYQQLIEYTIDDRNLLPLNQNKSYLYFVRTDDAIAQKIILKLENLGKPAYSHKILFIKEYRMATGLGLKECKHIMDEILRPMASK